MKAIPLIMTSILILGFTSLASARKSDAPECKNSRQCLLEQRIKGKGTIWEEVAINVPAFMKDCLKIHSATECMEFLSKNEVPRKKTNHIALGDDLRDNEFDYETFMKNCSKDKSRTYCIDLISKNQASENKKNKLVQSTESFNESDSSL